MLNTLLYKSYLFRTIFMRFSKWSRNTLFCYHGGNKGHCTDARAIMEYATTYNLVSITVAAKLEPMIPRIDDNSYRNIYIYRIPSSFMYTYIYFLYRISNTRKRCLMHPVYWRIYFKKGNGHISTKYVIVIHLLEEKDNTFDRMRNNCKF